MVRIFTVHARPLTRYGVAQALIGAPDFELVGQTASAAEALRVAVALEPDAITVDHRLPDGDGIELAAQLRAARPGLGTVVLGPARDRQLILRTAACGLSAYLPETAAAEELVAAVRHSVTSGNGFSARFLAAALRRGGRSAGDGTLSGREQQVLHLVQQGLGPREIADRLELGESTVKTYLSRIQAKLRVGSRAGLRTPG